MKSRKGKVGVGIGGVGATSTDLMVCFPSRSHLSTLKLMPKPICSPARVNEAKRHHHPHHLKKLTSNGHASPLLWVKPSNGGSTNNKKEKTGSSRCGVVSEEEPTSPKVTCAGQIKVRPTTATSNSNKACRNWQSVMEEIERIHNSSSTTRTRKKQKKTKKGSTTTTSIGYVMQFVTCLRSISFDFRCLRPFPEITSVSDDDDGEEEEEDDDDGNHSCYSNKNSCCKTPVVEQAEEGGSSAVFSKWFMVLQENHQQRQGHEIGKAEDNNQKKNEKQRRDEKQATPPPNALLLMRCRSAPATAHGRTIISTLDLEEIRKQVPPQEEEQLQTQQAEEEEEGKRVNPVESEVQGAKITHRIRRRRRQTLAFVMQNDTDFINRPFSTSHPDDPDITNIAKETWLTVDPFSRSKSWRR